MRVSSFGVLFLVFLPLFCKFVAALLDDLGKARLIDGQIVAVPGIYLLLGQVDDADPNLFESSFRHVYGEQVNGEGNEAL